MLWLHIAVAAAAAVGSTTTNTRHTTRVSSSLDRSGALVTVTAATLITATITTSTTKVSSTPYITIPLLIESDDAYYNAMVTDNSGNAIGVRVDLLQPDMWLMNGLEIIDCLELELYKAANLEVTQLQWFSISGTVYDATMCHLDGAFYPESTVTKTESSKTVTSTNTVDLASSSTLSVPYPNGIRVEGVWYAANLLFGTTENQKVPLDDFDFVLAADTNMFAGGLGLARSDSGKGVLDALKDQRFILALGYLVYLSGYNSNGTNCTGELLMGAVNQKYYTGTLYAFPQIPYEGWTSGLDTPLPIVVLDLISLESADSLRLVQLSTDATPVVLDTRLSFLFLPLDVVINLAIQANAYYTSEYDRWLVRCLDIENSNATVHFRFGELDVSIPIASFVVDAYLGDKYLYFASKVRACFLNVMPNSNLGYSSLGLPFLSEIYLAMDNEEGTVAMARAKPDVKMHLVDESASLSPFPLFTASLLKTADFSDSVDSESGRVNTSTAHSATVAFIESGFIPFAVLANYTEDYTMTFSAANASNAEAIPSRFTLATILSGEIYITKGDGGSMAEILTSDSASAANARKLNAGTGGSGQSAVAGLLAGLGGLIAAFAL